MARTSVIAILCVVVSVSSASAGVFMTVNPFRHSTTMGRFSLGNAIGSRNHCGIAREMGLGCFAPPCNAICITGHDDCCQCDCESVCEYCGETFASDTECDCLGDSGQSGGGGAGAGGGALGGSGVGGIVASGLFGFNGGGGSGVTGGGVTGSGVTGSGVTGSGVTGSGVGGLGNNVFGFFGGTPLAPSTGGTSTGVASVTGLVGSGEGGVGPLVPLSTIPIRIGVPAGEPEASPGAEPGVEVVPEPGSFLIYSIASLTIFVGRRRRI